MAAQSTQLRAVSAASHYHHYSNGNNDGGHAADADPPSCVTHQPRRLSRHSSELCAPQTAIAAMTTTPARTTTSTRTIAKTTPATVTKKTITTTTAPLTMTADSREDNIFCEDNNSRKVNCEDDTRNGDGEDDRDYDPRLPRGQQLPRGRRASDFHEDDCEDDTRNSDGEDDRDNDGSRDNDPRLPRGRLRR